MYLSPDEMKEQINFQGYKKDLTNKFKSSKIKN